jgi:hypothetical protein
LKFGATPSIIPKDIYNTSVNQLCIHKKAVEKQKLARDTSAAVNKKLKEDIEAYELQQNVLRAQEDSTQQILFSAILLCMYMPKVKHQGKAPHLSVFVLSAVAKHPKVQFRVRRKLITNLMVLAI